MANKQLGEVPLEVNGKTYTLVMDINAICELETLFSTPERDASFVEIAERVQRGSMRHVRGCLWAALRRHHKELSLEDAGALASSISELSTTMAALNASMTPDKADLPPKGKGSKARPQ